MPLKYKVIITFVVTVFTLGYLFVSNKDAILFRLYAAMQPCGIVFVDTAREWSKLEKGEIFKVCDVYKTASPKITFFLQPLIVDMQKGDGDAATVNNYISFQLSNVTDLNVFHETALHEFAHLVDIRNGKKSLSYDWLHTTEWVCTSTNDLSSCNHLCKQMPSKMFYCDSSQVQTLPSRYGTQMWNPKKTDVSVNPIEDFAESSRYFFEYNDALAITSQNRCKYLQTFYSVDAASPCFDCTAETVCNEN